MSETKDTERLKLEKNGTVVAVSFGVVFLKKSGHFKHFHTYYQKFWSRLLNFLTEWTDRMLNITINQFTE